ncbi:hypothetical protein GCM10017779_02420 [Streptomyces capillispiralis]|nr:hypothetical protein GCM10017779_02420 [Streptomyces capillispiralis]
MRTDPVHHDDAEREEQLLAQVGRLERPGERGEHGASCDPPRNCVKGDGLEIPTKDDYVTVNCRPECPV